MIRDSWYGALSLLFPAAVFLAVVLVLTGVRFGWVAAVAVLADLSGAAFWLCREEGLTVVPKVVMIVVGVPSCSGAAGGCSRARCDSAAAVDPGCCGTAAAWC